MSETGVKISGLPALPTRPTGTEPVVIVRDGVTYRAPSSYLDNLAPSIPYASPLTGDEIIGIEQDSAPVLSTLNDQLRLAAARHAGLVFDNVAQAQAQVASLNVAVGSTIYTAAFATPNDLGGGTYQRVAFEPAHAGKFQDSAGTWWELWSAVYRPEQFGVWSGGVTGSDTAIIAAAMALAATAGRSAKVAFAAGRRYRCGALLIPNIPASGNGAYLSLMSDGWSFIEAIAEGDTGYLWAPYNWIYGGTSGNRRTLIQGLYFDAKGLKDYGLVIRGNTWETTRCYFTGALLKGWLHTNQNRDKTAQGGSVNCSFFHCEARQNFGDGAEFDDTSVDYQVSHCYFTANVGWGVKFMNGAGCQIDTINVFGNNSGLAAGCAYFDQWGWATICVNSLFDGTSRGDVVVRSNNSTYAATWGPRNNVKNANLICEVLNPKLVLLDIEMQGDDARIIHNNGASASRQLQIMGGKSYATPFILFGDSAGTLGTTIASMHYNQGTDAWYDGRILTYPVRVTDGHAPSMLLPGRYVLNSSGTTVVTIPLTVAPEGLAGSWVDVDLKASVLGGVSPDQFVALARATVWAMCGRQFERSTRAFTAEVVKQSSQPAGNITFAAVMTMPGSADTMTATLTITVTHPVPSSDQNGVLYVDVRGLHRSVTAMTVAGA